MPKVKISDIDIYFDKDGNLLRHSYSYGNSTKEKNHIFSDTLEYVGYLNAGQGGNSHIQFKSQNSNRLYSMFISHFNDLVLAKRFINNIVAGDFYFTKKGNSQGIRLIIEDAP